MHQNPKSGGVHVSISAVQQQALQNGLFVVAVNRNNSEYNSIIDTGVNYLGASSIWNPLGMRLAQAPVGKNKVNDKNSIIVYATIDPAQYKNKNKKALEERRVSLYQEIALYMAPRSVNNSTLSHDVHAALIQYAPAFFNIEKNKTKIEELLSKSSIRDRNLLVFPEYSLTGFDNSIEQMKRTSQWLPDIITFFKKIALMKNTYVVYNAIEKSDNSYYNTVFLLNNKGELVGKYRKTHLNSLEKSWLKSGDSLPVFNTEIGKIALIIDDEVRFPEIGDVYSVKRADMIVDTSAWYGQYGQKIMVDRQLFAKPYPKNTNVLWDALAQNTQAYVLVSNLVGTKYHYLGSSGLYSLDPVNGYYPPVVSSSSTSQVLSLDFKTLAPNTWWTSQQILVDGRRPNLYIPLILNPKEKCFKIWKEKKNGVLLYC